MPDELSEDCCWNYERDMCVGSACTCGCHTYQKPPQPARDASDPDFQALYFELADAVNTLERTKRAAFDHQADGKQYWEAQNALDKLVGAALSWKHHRELYAELLRRSRARGESLHPSS